MRHTLSGHALLITSLALMPTLAACGGGQKKRSNNPVSAAEGPAPSTRITLAGGGTRYGQEGGAITGGKLVKAILDEAIASGQAAGAPLKASPALSATARALAPAGKEGRGFPQSALEAVASHHGVVEPIPITLVAEIPPNARTGQVAEAMGQAVARAVKGRRFNRIGVGAVRPKGREDIIAVVFISEKRVKLADFPRRLKVGNSARLKGGLKGDFKSPAVYVTRPKGKVDSLLKKGKGQKFAVDVKCTSKGQHQVEIMGEDAAGPRVLANFPLWCGERPPQAVAAGRSGGGITDPGKAEKALLKLINQARKQANLKPLKWDEKAAEVARAHSRDMRDNHFVAHVSPRTGDVGDRVERAGIDTPMVMENLSQAPTAEEAHEGLMGSPGHRAAILSPRATRVGVGVVRAKRAGGGLLVTQVYVARHKAFDAQAAVTAVARVMKNKKKKIKRDGKLDTIAADIARDMAKGKLKKGQTSERALKRLSKAKLKYRGAAVSIIQGPDPGPAVKKLKLDKRFGGYGIGAHGAKRGKEVTIIVFGLR